MEIIVTLLAIAGCLVVGGIIVNNPPIYDPPGFSIRLWTYLTTHVAETRRDHRFPELELRCYTLVPRSLFTWVERAVMVLGWDMQEVDTEEYRLHAVVTTPLLKFKDDVEITLIPAACGTELHIRSCSRVGWGDLGANTRHILDLLTAIDNLPWIDGEPSLD